MTIELQNKLTEKYSFIDCSMDVGDGWYKLIDNLCFELLLIVKDMRHFKIDTIKYKFGYLNVYTSAGFDLDSDICKTISKYTQESQYICSDCGYDFRKQEIKTGKCSKCGRNK